MKLFKLTDANAMTHNETKWGEGVTHKISEATQNPKLCTDGVIHVYKNLNFGLLLYPIHANIPRDQVRCWEAEGDIVCEDWGKAGCFKVTVVKELELPIWYRNLKTRVKVQVAFAGAAAKSAESAARAAARAAEYAEDAVEYASDRAEYASAHATHATRAARAAESAACAAEHAEDDIFAACAAEHAARAAEYAACAAKYAEDAAHVASMVTGPGINFEKMADDAVVEVMEKEQIRITRDQILDYIYGK